MLNMLKEFYSYLSDKIVEYMQVTNDIEGYKYSITFENNEEVRGLYEHLQTVETAKEFIYRNNGQEVYRSFYLQINDKKLIVAATIDQVKTDFLTTLRNHIGTSKEGFKDAGLLIIYDAALDSIANATQSFQKEGMPFHVNSIVGDIYKILEHSNMSLVDQEVIKYELERRKTDTYKDSTSLFEYKEILAAIHAGQIKPSEYKDFRLFYDPDLASLEKHRDIQKRLEENNHYFEKIDQTIRFGDVEKDLDSVFTEKLIGKIKKDGWEDELTYKEVAASVDEKKKVEDIQVKQIEVYINNAVAKENVDYFIRGIGSPKVQLRNKDVIIFNQEGVGEVKMVLTLTKSADRNTIKSLTSCVKVISSKKIEVTFNMQRENCNYECIQAKDDIGNSKIKVNLCAVGLPKQYLEPLLTSYTLVTKKKKEQCYICINTEAEQIVLNPRGNTEEELLLKNNEEYQVQQGHRLILTKTEGLIEEDGKVAVVTLNVDGLELRLGINDDSKKMTVMTGLNAWKAKMEKKYSFMYLGENRIVHGTNEYYTRDEFKDNLALEAQLIENGGLSWIMRQGELQSVDLELVSEVKEVFLQLMQYYRAHDLLPSLTYYDEELLQLSEAYIQAILRVTEGLEDGKTLPRAMQNIMRLGTICLEDASEQIRFTPLSPLNVAYQLELYRLVDAELLKEESLLKKLSHTALLPYIKGEYKDLYKPVDQWHSPEWTYFVPNEMKRYKGSRSFVSKLVKEKIEEFVKHFSYLFDEHHTATIKINLVNTGDCKEILQGICAYYIECLKKDVKIEALNPIQVNIYNEEGITHIFEEFSNYVDLNEIKEKFEINLDTHDRYSEREVLGAIRENLNFYDKAIQADHYDYAHITFIEMNQKSDTGIGNMSEINTGVSLKGMISGVPSVHYSESYRTGFGTKLMDEEVELVKLARRLNSISRVFGSSDPYYGDQCITTELDKRDEANLEKVYNASNWVTFIQPKVDLNFFKTDEASKDLLIIHYSDQYSTASGYDAITVTRKSKQYQSIIEEHLKQKNVQNAQRYTPQIINMFNAVNGDWLLRLISSKSYFDKEKISILSAIKLSLAYFNHENILWVPISLEEILRVSGGAGLKKSEGIFSAKNLGFSNNGATSDDLMLVGLEEKDTELYVHYYPIEVKIGVNAANYIQKAITQVKSTSQIFKETLIKKESNFKTNIYRNFMMQLVIVSMEKLKLYNIWPEQNWDAVLETDLRRRLLNEEYTISTELEPYIGVGGVVSFKKELQFRHVTKEEDVTILEFTEEDGINYITKGIDEIKEMLKYQYQDLDQSQLLANQYSEAAVAIEPTVNIEHDEPSIPIDIPVEIVDEEIPLVEKPIEQVKASMEVLFGTNQSNGQELIWYPNDTDKVLHTNTGIIGTMGTGKTQFTKSVITQLHRESKNNLEGKPLGILIFDYKGDYNKSKQDFIDATGAKVYELYHLPYNPLALINTPDAKNLLPLHTASNLKETLTKGFGLGQVQSNLLKDLIMEAYENKGIHKANRATWDKTPPTLQDVYNVYINREDLKEDSLYAAFSNLIDFEIFEPDATKTKPLFDLIDGVTVIDLSGYDESVQNLVVAITLDLFYTQMQSLGHSKINGSIRQLSKIILVDEADNFLSKDFNALKKILKEGREFGVGTILSTQLLSHFSTADNDFASYILTWVVHNVADLSTKDVRFIFNTHSKSEEDELYNKIKSLNKHYSLMKMGNSDKAIHIRDRAFWELDK